MVHSMVQPMVPSNEHSLVHLMVHSMVDSLVHSMIHSTVPTNIVFALFVIFVEVGGDKRPWLLVHCLAIEVDAILDAQSRLVFYLCRPKYMHFAET